MEHLASDGPLSDNCHTQPNRCKDNSNDKSSITYTRCMFNVLATDDIKVLSLAFKTYTTNSYTKEGMHSGHNKDIVTWLLANSDAKGMGMCNSKFCLTSTPCKYDGTSRGHSILIHGLFQNQRAGHFIVPVCGLCSIPLVQ